MSLISEIMLRKFLRQSKTKTALPPLQSLNTPCRACQGNVSTLKICFVLKQHKLVDHKDEIVAMATTKEVCLME